MKQLDKQFNPENHRGLYNWLNLDTNFQGLMNKMRMKVLEEIQKPKSILVNK